MRADNERNVLWFTKGMATNPSQTTVAPGWVRATVAPKGWLNSHWSEFYSLVVGSRDV